MLNHVKVDFQLELNPNALAKTFRDEYKLGPCLGRGAFSEVYIAKLRNKGVHHIVKAIYKDRFKHQTKALQQFTQEISILMLLEKHVSLSCLYF
jgi:serine/threonine protein kinase